MRYTVPSPPGGTGTFSRGTLYLVSQEAQVHFHEVHCTQSPMRHFYIFTRYTVPSPPGGTGTFSRGTLYLVPQEAQVHFHEVHCTQSSRRHFYISRGTLYLVPHEAQLHFHKVHFSFTQPFMRHRYIFMRNTVPSPPGGTGTFSLGTLQLYLVFHEAQVHFFEIHTLYLNSKKQQGALVIQAQGAARCFFMLKHISFLNKNMNQGFKCRLPNTSNFILFSLLQVMLINAVKDVTTALGDLMQVLAVPRKLSQIS